MAWTKGLLPCNEGDNIFEETNERLNKRIRSRLSRWEMVLLALNVGLIITFYLNWRDGAAGFPDLFTYLAAANGDYQGFYYTYWILPLFKVLHWIPDDVVIILWALLNLLGIFFATRVFGNRPAILLSTYQVFYILFYGQILGLILGGLGLFWWGLKQGKYIWAGGGLLVASTKYHIGLPLALFMLVLHEIEWVEVLKTLFVPFIAYLLTFLFYPQWPISIIENLRASPPNTLGNISLWQWIGPVSLILWLPVLVISMPKIERMILLVATLSLTLPYCQQTDLLAIFIFPVGYFAWLGNFGFTFLIGRWQALKWLAIIPSLIYLIIIVRNNEGFNLIKKRSKS